MPLDAARAVGEYGGAIEASIIFLKQHPYLCKRLRRLLVDAYQRFRPDLASDLIIPIPLHRLREKERGFNQADVIARVLASELAIPVGKNILSRVRATARHRLGMDAHDRSRSVEGAFEIAKAGALLGARVLLVDDLFTTGSTICAAALCLREAGAEAVSALTIGRVLLH